MKLWIQILKATTQSKLVLGLFLVCFGHFVLVE